MRVYENKKYKEREVTAIVCHWSLLPMDSSVPSVKALTSSGRRRPWAKLWTMRPPSPFSHTRTLASARRGIPSSSKLGCHADTGREEDATCVPTWAEGSWIVTPLDGWGGVRVWASLGLANIYSVVRGILRVRAGGGGGGRGGWTVGVWPSPWGGCCCATWHALGINQLIDKVLQVTISSPQAGCVLEELLDSAAACLASWTRASGSAGSSCWMALWASSRRRRDVSSANSFLIGASSSEHV